MFVKSKSICFQKLIENIDTVLARIYSETTTGEPLGYNSDEWCNARDRLMSIKVGSEHNHTYPINFQLADHFILSEFRLQTTKIVRRACSLNAILEVLPIFWQLF